MRGTWVRFLGWKDPLEEGIAIHSNVFPGETPWTEEPGGLQYMGSQKVGNNWGTKHKDIWQERFERSREEELVLEDI